MSQLKVNTIRHTGASSDAIELATDGSCTVKATNNLSNRRLNENGAMNIAQRNTSKSSITSGGYYVHDRWYLGYGTAGTWTLSQSTETPNNFGKSLKLECTTANGSLSAASNLQIKQFFEGQNLQVLEKGTATAKQITVSFWVKTNKTGTYIVELMDHDNSNRHCGKSYTVSDTNWNRYTLTFPADTTGTLDDDNARSFDVGFWLVAGTNFTSGSLQTTWGALSQTTRAVGQVNLADSTSNEFHLTGVQLEVGDVATDFEHISYGDELARCQRYCYALDADGSIDTWAPIAIGRHYNSTHSQFLIPFPVKMRYPPTIDAGATSAVGTFSLNSNGTFNATTATSLALNERSYDSATVSVEGPTSLTTGLASTLYCDNTDVAKLVFTAEL